MDHPRLYFNDHCTPGTEWVRFTPLEVPRDRVWTAKDDARYRLGIRHGKSALWRQLVLPKRIDNWSLTSLQQRPVKTGGRLVKHDRYYWLLLAEGHLTRRLFGGMVRRIAALTMPAG